MKVLAFDTATGATSVALLDSTGGYPIEARDDPEPGQRPRHTTRLMVLIVEVMERAGCGWDEVDRIAVGVGPGTFTGLRIGVATARALARARGIGLVGVSTLQSLALGAADEARRQGCQAVLAVLDARRGEVFAAAWPTDGGSGPAEREQTDGVGGPAEPGLTDGVGGPAGRGPLLEPLALAPSALAQTAAELGETRLGIGDGAVAFRAVLERSGTAIPDDRSRLHRVNAVFTGQLALHSHPVRTGDVRPEYLRLPDAEMSLPAAQER